MVPMETSTNNWSRPDTLLQLATQSCCCYHAPGQLPCEAMVTLLQLATHLLL